MQGKPKKDSKKLFPKFLVLIFSVYEGAI